MRAYLYFSWSQIFLKSKSGFLTFSTFCTIFIYMIDTLKDLWHLSLSSLDEWVKKHSRYDKKNNSDIIQNYKSTYSRLLRIWEHLPEWFSDPIVYIISLSKEKHYSDRVIAKMLNDLFSSKDEENNWTSKMIFTLRNQIWLEGNDGIQYLQSGDQNVKEYNQRNTKKIEEIIDGLPAHIESISTGSSLEETLDSLFLSTNWKNIDAFFQEMVSTHNFWERPIKKILDILYDVAEIQSGKWYRVGMVYIRTKISALRNIDSL